MPDLCPKGIDLDVKPSAPSCPPTLPLYSGLQTEQTESQRTPPRGVALVSVKTQTEIQTAQVEVQTTPVSVWPQTTVVSIETQTIEVRDEVVDRRQRDKDKQVSPINPWDHMHRAARETEEQPHKLLPLHKAPTGRNNQSKRVNKPFLIKKYKESRRIWETI